MSPSTIVVTGATGNIGRELVRKLLDRGLRVRAIGRSEERLHDLEKGGAEPVIGRLDDPAFLARAFAGAAAAFTMIPPSYGEPDFRAYQRRLADALATAAAAAGVRQVVNLSSVGAHLAQGVGPIGGLHDAEQRFHRLADAAIVHLRPAYFMENHLHGLGLIRASGSNGGALRPDLSLPMIATRDIAAAAAELLAAPPAAGHTVRELLGPRDYTLLDVTRILGEAIGKPDLGYLQFPYDAVRQTLLGFGMSPSAADLMVEMNRAFNDGVCRPTGKRAPANTTPTTLETFAREVFAPAYRAAGSTASPS